MDEKFTGCSSVESPVTMTIAAALRAHIMGTSLAGALGSVRQVQWAAVSRCYTSSGVDTHLGALILMLLGTRTMNCDRSFAHGLRTACPRTALALPGFRRPAVRRRRPSVMLERFREKLVTLGNQAKLRSTFYHQHHLGGTFCWNLDFSRYPPGELPVGEDCVFRRPPVVIIMTTLKVSFGSALCSKARARE